MMPDREKVIGHLNDCMEASRRDNAWVFVRKDIVEDALALLKKQETQKFLVDESGKITPLPVVVRCKDCKHRPKEPNYKTYESGFDIEFPEGSKCPCRCSGDGFYSWYPEDDWFCADGERQEGR
jgi:hypothetical protein